MDIYMSYSINVRINEKEKNKRNQQNLQLANFAISQYKKYYNNVYLITDTEGKELFKDTNFTEIFNILDIVPKKYEDVWSLGKMYAIRHIASLKKQFCHSDMDFFIKKPFKENIMNAEAFAQSYEYNPYLWGLYYRIELFNDLCKNKYLATDAFKQSDFTLIPERSIVLGKNLSQTNRFAFSPIPLCCGVLGGKNYDFFYEYSDTSIKMVEDPENEPYWMNPEISKKNWGTKAIVAEQFYLACCLKKYKIKPELMFEKNYLIDYCPIQFRTEDFDHWINEKKDYFMTILNNKESFEKYMKSYNS
jgi:hypothetical protein